eukprot:869512_1
MELNIDKCLHLVGIGDNVVIQYNMINIKNHIYFKDIKIKISEAMTVTSECMLFMDHCSVDFHCEGILPDPNSVIDVKNCSFNGGESSYAAISIGEVFDDVSSITCTQCVFKGCGSLEGTPCISLDDASTDDLTDGSFKLVNNLFINNCGLPIGSCELSGCLYVKQNEAIFEGNRMKLTGKDVGDDLLWLFVNQ